SGQIAIANGGILTLESSGTYNFNGNLSLNSSGSISDLTVTGGGTTTLGGTGTITLSNNFNNRIYGNSTNALSIGSGVTLQGAGQIGLGLTAISNNGTITANQPAGLTINPSATGFTNTGTIQSSGSGTFTLMGGPFTNTSGSILVGAGTTD